MYRTPSPNTASRSNGKSPRASARRAGLTPFLDGLGLVIWALFAIEFGVSLLLAPSKLDYFKRNWLKAIALLAYLATRQRRK